MADLGRPTTFSNETADAICERIADGESLRSICDDDGMPDKATVFRWLSSPDHVDFRDQYALARETQADSLFDDILLIADDGRNDWMERKDKDDANMGWRENGEALRRSQLRVDSRKWMAARLQPKKYGDKVTSVLEGGDKPIEVAAHKPRDVAKALALILARGMKDKAAE